MEACNREGSRNVKLVLEYDGTRYCGFQRQVGVPTIQAKLEAAIEAITKMYSHVTAAGRTDAGAHAIGQVVNFRTCSGMFAEKFVPALNSVLPRDIRIISSEEVPWEFHARYDARWKTYEAGSISVYPQLHLSLEYSVGLRRNEDSCRVFSRNT